MACDLLLAIGITLALLMLLMMMAPQQAQGHLAGWLQRLSQRPSRLWTIGVGLIIALSLLRWPLQR